jgi:ParB-like chromosome segregation protein Spo0J
LFSASQTEATLADKTALSNRGAPLLPCTELVPIGLLWPNPKNARTHSKKQLGLIKASIERFGQIKPVIVDDANIILAGHGFVEAAGLAGLSHVAVSRFGHLTQAQKRAYLIADNRIAAS